MARASGYPKQALQDVQQASFVSFLNLSRWTAASVVFLGHLRDPLFQGYANVAGRDRNPFVQVWYFVTGLSYEAVIVFFVLSGYLVGGLGVARLSAKTFSLQSYAIDRITRLYVALLPALLLTALLDSVGQSVFGDVGFWQATQPLMAEKFPGASFVATLTVRDFIQNVCMLQTVRTLPFGSNLPLWTISLEFWFYVVFGVAMATYLATSWRIRGIGAVVVCIALALLGWRFPLYMGMWFFGVIAAATPWRWIERPVLASAFFCVSLIAARILHPKIHHDSALGWGADYLVALGFAWLLISFRSRKSVLLQKMSSLNRLMADFSYSLYLVHFPLMLFLLAIVQTLPIFAEIAMGYSPDNPSGLFAYAIVATLVYLGAWIFSLGTERKTAKVRNWLRKLLSKPDALHERV